MKNSFLLDKPTAIKAFFLAKASIEALVDQEITERRNLHYVILDPTKKHGTCEFQEAILLESFLGERQERYFEVALKKAEVSWRTGLDSLTVQQQYPFLYVEGDTKWGGSVVRNGLVVAVSGLEEWADIFCSGVIADACLMLVREKMRGIMNNVGITFF